MVGGRIKALREELGKSQEELAHDVGMHANTVARWERGELTPRGTSLAKIARALNTTSAYLLEETDDPELPRNILSIDSTSPNGGESNERRLIIKNRDMYVDLPDTSEGFEILRRFFEMQTAGKHNVNQTAVMA